MHLQRVRNAAGHLNYQSFAEVRARSFVSAREGVSMSDSEESLELENDLQKSIHQGKALQSYLLGSFVRRCFYRRKQVIHRDYSRVS
jgi:hypothetical protein